MTVLYMLNVLATAMERAKKAAHIGGIEKALHMLRHVVPDSCKPKLWMERL